MEAISKLVDIFETALRKEFEKFPTARAESDYFFALAMKRNGNRIPTSYSLMISCVRKASERCYDSLDSDMICDLSPALFNLTRR